MAKTKDFTGKQIKARSDIELGKFTVKSGTEGTVLGYANGFVQVKWNIEGEPQTFCDQLDIEKA